MHLFHAHKYMYRPLVAIHPTSIHTHLQIRMCIFLFIYICVFLEHVLIYVYSSLNIYVSIRVLFFGFLNKLGFVGTCMHTYKHIYIYTYTFAGIHVCVYVCAHTYIPTITYTCMCADLYVHMRFVYVHAYVYMWTYMHLCMFICIRTYLSIEIDVYIEDIDM